MQETLTSDGNSDKKETILNAHLLICTMGLLQGNWNEALKAADEAQRQLQLIDHASTDASGSTSSSSVYGLRGYLTLAYSISTLLTIINYVATVDMAYIKQIFFIIIKYRDVAFICR